MNRKTAVLLIVACTLSFEVPVYVGLIVSQHQSGHIRILNGSNAGISVTPTFLEFGNVTWEATITKQITITYTGNCVEHVNATALTGNTEHDQHLHSTTIPATFHHSKCNLQHRDPLTKRLHVRDRLDRHLQLIPPKRIPSSDYKRRILAAVTNSEVPISVDSVRQNADLHNWETIKALLLELALEGSIKAQRTSRGWIFYHPNLFSRDEEVPVQ